MVAALCSGCVVVNMYCSGGGVVVYGRCSVVVNVYCGDLVVDMHSGGVVVDVYSSGVVANV